jgi:hypothetical protein
MSAQRSLSGGKQTWSGLPLSVAIDPTETLPIDCCALRGPDLYAILYEDDRALCLACADEDDSIVRLVNALDDAALERLLAYATTSRKRFEAKSAVRFWRILLTAS